jgi:hypothetical protein
MQKKLYFLNEEEKNRIINLHESATKKQYLLNEQTTLPKGSWTKEQKEVFDSTISNFGTYSSRGPLIKNIKNFCRKNVFGEITLSTQQIQANANKIEMAMNQGSKWTYGLASRGVTNKTIPLFEKYLKELGNIVNFCWSINNITNLRDSGESILDIFDEIQSNNAGFTAASAIGFIPNILKPLQVLSNQTTISDQSSTTPSTTSTQPPTQWTGPKCLDEYKMEYNEKYNYYKGKYYLYFPDSTYTSFEDPNTPLGTYTCDRGGNLKTEPSGSAAVSTTPDKTKTKTPVPSYTQTPPAVQQEPSGIGVVTRNVQNEIPILLKQAGLEGQPINQDTINKLYDILSKK